MISINSSKTGLREFTDTSSGSCDFSIRTCGRTNTAGAPKKATKIAPHQQIKRLKAGKPAKRSSHRPKSAGQKASPSSAGDEDSVLSEVDASDLENTSQNAGRQTSADDEDMDDVKYCTCRSVSYGDMVACDNDDCPYEWFHWSCVGLTKEPAGKWYCPECRRKMNS